MKDFINAAQAGAKISASQTDEEYKKSLTDAQTKKTARDNDPDQLELQDKQARANLAATTARTGLIGEQVKNAATSRAYTAALTNRVNNPGMGADGSGLLPPGGAVGPSGPVAPSGPALQNTMTPGVTDNYAQGGVIPDGPDAENDDDEDDTSLEMRAGKGQTNIQGLSGVVSPQLVHDAVKGGYAYGMNVMGLAGGGAARSARGRAAAYQLAQGAGALTPQEMAAAKKAVDPDGKLTDSQRNMAALGSVYQYWANKGEPEKAQKVAFQMLQHFRMASQRYAAIAAHAAEQGNMDLATKAAVQAYANVPDGKDMNLTVNPDGRIMYHYTDENGKTINKGIATPQELASSAMGLARNGFDQAILSAAGQREEAAKATSSGKGGPKPEKVQDLKTRQEILDQPLQDAQAAWEKKNGAGGNVDWGTIKDAATHIMQQNPDATPSEAVDSAMGLMFTKGKNPAPDFSTTSQDGSNTIKFKNGRTIKLDDTKFDELMTQRAAHIKSQQDQETQDKADATKSASRWDAVKKAGSKIGGAIADDASQFAGEVQNAIPDELKQRGKAALDTAGQVISDYGRPVLDAATNPNINYGTLTTAIGHGVQQGVNAAMQALRGGGSQAAPQQSPQPGPGAIPSQPDDPTQYQGTM